MVLGRVMGSCGALHGGLAVPYGSLAASYRVMLAAPYVVLWHLTGSCGALLGLAAPYAVLRRLIQSCGTLQGSCGALRESCGALRGLKVPYGLTATYGVLRHLTGVLQTPCRPDAM